MKYVIGIDFGSDSVRSVVADAADGSELASAVVGYPLWKQGFYCNPSENRYRQHPQEHLDCLEQCLKEVLSQCAPEVVRSVVGISLDSTASTPVITDRNGTPLAMLPEFREDPDAMFVLWKDHTSIDEADRINEVSWNWKEDFTRFCGGAYSCEWDWAKVLHIFRTNPAVRRKAYSWVEHCDWITGTLCGNTVPEKMARSRCVAGHKAMWNAAWGGLPSWEFLHEVDPLLDVFKGHLYTETVTGDRRIGGLCPEWAEKLGLNQGIAVGVGAIDCHVGAVGSGIEQGILVKVMGTSTCDIYTARYEDVGDRPVKGICGQVDGSVLPGFVGFEAGQSAFGDVYAWLSRFTGKSIVELTEEAEKLPVTQEDMVALDWFNGRRTPDADHRVKAAISGLTLGSTPGEVFKALVEATAFGSRAINERFDEEGIPVRKIVAVGGISRKSPYVMQTMADVMGMPVSVVDSDQACALGAAMFAAVAAGVYGSVPEAQKAMKVKYCAEYVPNTAKSVIYDRLYEKYRKLGLAAAELK